MAEVSESRRGPGARLKAAREDKGWSKTETATRLHLSVNVLDELESDVLRASVELPFMRGYLRNYAKLLGLSADELVKSFDAQHRGRGEEQRVKPIVKHKHEPLEASSPLGYVVGLGLLLAVGGAYFWLNSNSVAPEAPVAGELAAGEPVSTEPVPEAPRDEAPVEEAAPMTTQPAPALAAVPASDAASGASVPPPAESQLAVTPPSEAARGADAVPTMAPEQAAGPAQEPPAATTPSAEPVAAVAGQSAALAMNFTGDCWIKIEDATGAVLSRGLKRTGHTMTLAGVPPFKLILGNPDAVALTFKGETVDLSQYPANKVAKLQLGANG